MKVLCVLSTGLLASVACASSGVNFSSYEFTGTDGRHLTLGYSFTADEAVDVTALGVFDHLGDGLTEGHEVGLWDPTTVTLLRSVIVPAGSASFQDGFFQYEPIEAVTLEAGHIYVVGAFYQAQGPDRWTWGTPPTNYPDWQVAPEITFNVGMYAYDVFMIPHQITWPFYGGGNVYLHPVPEPATILVIGAGVVAMLRRRRR